MAQNTISEEIADLETKISLLDDKIEEQQHLSELEEGGAGSRFRAEYTDTSKLHNRRDVLNTRLQTLYRGLEWL